MTVLASAASCIAETGDAEGVAAARTGELVICQPTAEIFVSDSVTFGANNGGVIRVRPTNGARSTLSENNNPVGGPDFETPEAIAFEADGNLVVADSWSVGAVRIPGVVRVKPSTGVRTVVSNNTAPAGGPSFVGPTGIAVEASGSILVADGSAFPQNNGGVIRVDPVTGARTTLSRNGLPAGGPLFENPWDVAVAPNGDIYVVDPVDFVGAGQVIRVDATTGARTLISNNTSPAGGPLFVWPWGITLDAAGNILVSDMQAFGGNGGIIRVDPITGVRTTVSENNQPAGGPSFGNPGDLIVERCGSILITDTITNAVLRVNPVTGVRTTVSDNASPGLPNFAYAYGIAAKFGFVLPPPPPAGGGSGAHDD